MQDGAPTSVRPVQDGLHAPTVSPASLEVMKKLLVIVVLLGLGGFAVYKLRST